MKMGVEGALGVTLGGRVGFVVWVGMVESEGIVGVAVAGRRVRRQWAWRWQGGE